MTWHGAFGMDADDEEEDEESPLSEFALRDGSVFLIDWRSDHRRKALVACKELLQRLAVSSSRDLTAVVLYASSKTTTAEMRHICVLQNFSVVNVDRVKQLEQLCSLKGSALLAEYSVKSDASMADALWTCQNLFASSGVKLGSRRILLFTSDDSPHSNEKHRRQQLRTKIRDLEPTNIELLILPLTTDANDSFNTTVFYCDHLLPEESFCGLSTSVDELVQSAAAQVGMPRAIARIPLTIDMGDKETDVACSVSLHKLAYRAPIPAAVKLSRDTNQVVKSTTRYYLQETAELLLKTDLMKAVIVGGKKVPFEMDEVKQMKQMGLKTGLKLLAFYHLERFKSHFHVKSSSFIRPDERGVQGSTCFLTALLQSCLKLKRFAVCSCTSRSGASPALVALIPQKEVRNDCNKQLVPSGFHMVPLPYADDFRKLNIPSSEHATDDEISAAKQLIKEFVEPQWSAGQHNNPALRRHWAHIEALALDKEEVEDLLDNTLPDSNKIHSKSKTIHQFVHCLELDAPDAKKAKVDIQKAWSEGRLEKLTVPILKAAISDLGLSAASQRKADLVDEINKHFKKK